MSEKIPKALSSMLHIMSSDILKLRDMLDAISSDELELNVDQLRRSIDVAKRFLSTMGWLNDETLDTMGGPRVFEDMAGWIGDYVPNRTERATEGVKQQEGEKQ
jgi:hypothetical protein